MNNVVIYDHPLIQHKLSVMRKKDTTSKDFKQLLVEISMLMGFEISRDFKLEKYQIETPMEKCEAQQLAEGICICPLLRAGTVMAEGLINLIPTAHIGHIGVSLNNITQSIQVYYEHLPPNIEKQQVILCDPMLGNGIYLVKAVEFLKERGVKQIKIMSLIAAPEGISAITHKHPDIQIHVAAVDQKIDERGIVYPGLGHAGDRIFGTTQE